MAGAPPQLEQPVDWQPVLQPQLLWKRLLKSNLWLLWQPLLQTGTQTRTFLQTL